MGLFYTMNTKAKTQKCQGKNVQTGNRGFPFCLSRSILYKATDRITDLSCYVTHIGKKYL